MPDPTRVLHVHVDRVSGSPDHETVILDLSISVGMSAGSAISDSTSAEIDLRILGIYRTGMQMNGAVAEAAKAYLLSAYSIPTGGYTQVYVTGAYGLL